MAFMTAGDVKLADPLKETYSGIGAKRQASLEEMLGRVKSRNRASQIASGRPMGSYTAPTLDFAGTSAGRGVEDALYGSLGGASYKDVINDQEHQRKIALAKRIGSLMSPSLAQQILGGIGMAGQVAPALIGAGKSIYGSFQGSQNPTVGSNLRLYGDTNSLNPYSQNLDSALGRRLRGFDYSPSSYPYMTDSTLRYTR